MGEFPSEYTPTIFENYVAEIRLDGKAVQLALWDTAGQEEYERLRPLSYNNSHVILIAFALDTPDSLENVTVKWNEEVRSICGEGIPVLLVGLKRDLRDGNLNSGNGGVVTQAEGEQTAQSIGARAYKECSALLNEGVDEIFEAATRAAMLEGMPARIRIVSHPPLPPLKAWLPIPSSATKIEDLANATRGLLGLASGGEGVELELEGFALLPEAGVEMLDFASDILEYVILSSSCLVPPGHGLPRTKKRNARKRLLKASTSGAAAAVGEVMDGSGGKGKEESTHLPSPAPSARLATATPQPSAPLAASAKGKEKEKALDPYHGMSGAVGGLREEERLDMVHLARGNKNKRKVIPARMLKEVGRKTVFGNEGVMGDEVGMDVDGAGAGGVSTRADSPTFTPGSPSITPATYFPPPSDDLTSLNAGDISISSTSSPKGKKGKKGKGGRKSWIPTPPPWTPSLQTNLPRNLVVTKVDVESEGWVAGVGEVVQGSSKDWVVESGEIGEWLELEQLVEKWTRGEFRKVGMEEKDGLVAKAARVVTSVLELDPSTFTPTISYKYGTLLPSADASLRIKLHPSLLASLDAEGGEEEYDEYEGEGWGKPKMKFGQSVEVDAFMDAEEVDGGEEDVWEGEWGDVRVL
ncbi:hypothetical protein MNV49_007537 [Pseudohyphozyma bogoriensis]|nr:hypothetical protein MNV49_007537 [Pseudohyphozyma bogoriensis]